MRPPPRTRVKPVRNVIEEKPRTKRGRWQLRDQKKLIKILQSLRKKQESTPEDIDYRFIAEQLPGQSHSAIQSYIETQKYKVITSAITNVKQQETEKRETKKPIEEWTSLASVVAGTLEESISNAFSQLLTVSSTEPLTLKNSVPPQTVNKGTGQDKSVSHPITCLPVQGQPSGTTGPNNKKSLASQPSAASFLKKGNHIRKVDASKTCTEREAVNFEKIYHYLRAIDSPGEDCHLTPMESAIVLNLLMSLPEQLSLLDCSAFHKHLTQVHACFSSADDSEDITTLFKSLKKGVDSQRNDNGSGSSITTDKNSNMTGTADSTGASDSEPQLLTEGQSAGTDATSDLEPTEFCPPLNPFVVPVALLRRKKLNHKKTSSTD